MKVSVTLVGILAQYAGAPEVEIHLPEGARLADLHRVVGGRPGSRFPSEVWDPAAERFTACVRTFVGEEDVEDLSRPLASGDRVTLLTMIAGGLRPGFLPPNQRLTEKFPVLHLGPVPAIPEATWQFTVEGEVEAPIHLTRSDLQTLPRTVQRSDFHCVTGWSRLGDEWEGVRVRDVLALAIPTGRDGAGFALFLAEGGYTTDLALADATATDVLLAVKFNGAPLTPEHGGPVRLLVPSKYAYKSAKWVRGVVLSRERQLGYWESRGYSTSADPWKDDRYSR
ncbi:MAG: molybdopterin-dependent oxidoreductase [Chloroflexi bacterium]|nr:molybdopterin-dependent oxidoreductase [Chloroflexota bacterium]